MKKLLALITLLMAFSVVSFSQVTANATASATVNVVITVTRTADLALGSVNQGGTSTVLSKGVGAAAFTVSGASNASTTCTFTFPANLVNGANDLPFTGQIPTFFTTNVQASSTTFASLTGGSATTSATGGLFLWAGGGVTASATQAAGLYTGQITVAVTQP